MNRMVSSILMLIDCKVSAILATLFFICQLKTHLLFSLTSLALWFSFQILLLANYTLFFAKIVAGHIYLTF